MRTKWADLLWTLHLSGQTEQQLVWDRVHQVQEGSVLVQDVVQWGSFQTKILAETRREAEGKSKNILKWLHWVCYSVTVNPRESCISNGSRAQLCQGQCDWRLRDKRGVLFEIFIKGDRSFFIYSSRVKSGGSHREHCVLAFIITPPWHRATELLPTCHSYMHMLSTQKMSALNLTWCKNSVDAPLIICKRRFLILTGTNKLHYKPVKFWI